MHSYFTQSAARLKRLQLENMVVQKYIVYSINISSNSILYLDTVDIVYPFAILAECQGAKAAKAICMRCACQEYKHDDIHDCETNPV